MEKKIFNAKEKPKRNSKPKEIKIFNEYIPVKKAYIQPNISDYETEQSFPRNNSNKYVCIQTNPNPSQSIYSKQFNPFILFNNYNTTKKNTNVKTTSEYENILSKKIKYISNLKRQLSSIQKEIIGFEKNCHINSTKKRSSSNCKMKSVQLNPKVLYVNKMGNNPHENNHCNYLLTHNNFPTSLSCNKSSKNNSTNENKNDKQVTKMLTENNISDIFSHLQQQSNINKEVTNGNNNSNGSSNDYNKNCCFTTQEIKNKCKTKYYDTNTYYSTRGTKNTNNYFNNNIKNSNWMNKYQKSYNNKVNMIININNYIKYINNKDKKNPNIMSLSSGYKSNEKNSRPNNKRNLSEKNKVISLSNENKDSSPVIIISNNEIFKNMKEMKDNDNESFNTNVNTNSNSNTNTYSITNSNNNTINNDFIKLEKRARDLFNKYFDYYHYTSEEKENKDK